MPTPTSPMTLADLPKVLVARVSHVEDDCTICERLRELGFCPGTEVRFERQAPFGGPMIVSLRGYRLSLRPSEARRIFITPLGGQVAP